MAGGAVAGLGLTFACAALRAAFGFQILPTATVSSRFEEVFLDEVLFQIHTYNTNIQVCPVGT